MAALAGLPRAVRAEDQPIPPEGIGHRIKHLSYSDIGGRPDSVQIMSNRKHLYVGHMFGDGVTILDASDPRRLKPVSFFTAGQYTRTHHLQASDDLLLVANGANIVAMQSYSDQRGYFENSLAESITKRKNFRSGLSIHDISKPGEMREIAFLEMPGLGVNRLSWMGGRYAYVSAHFDGFTDHCLCIVDLQEITKPVIASKWWLPGMNRAAGEVSNTPKGKRYALHHMIVAGKLGYGAWRDGGFTIHDVSDAAQPKLLSHLNWSPPFPGGTHTPLPLPGRNLAVVADEANAEKCAKGLFQIFVIDVRVPENPVTISTMPVPHDRDLLRRSRHLRSAQSAREPAWLVPERGNHFCHLQCRRRPRVRPQGSVCAEGTGVLAAAGASQADRSEAQRRARRQNSRCLCDAGWTDL
jgi:hypothetical protein